jgi:hypothetical protein
MQTDSKLFSLNKRLSHLVENFPCDSFFRKISLRASITKLFKASLRQFLLFDIGSNTVKEKYPITCFFPVSADLHIPLLIEDSLFQKYS